MSKASFVAIIVGYHFLTAALTVTGIYYVIVPQYEEQITQLESRNKCLSDTIDFLNDHHTPMLMVEKVTTGVRNKNPMNIHARGLSDPWEGQIGKDERGHAIFRTYEHGLRAGALVLLNYYHKHGLDTVTKIINRFCRGNQQSYIKFICKRIGVEPDEKISVPTMLPDLMMSMVRFENGFDVFPAEKYLAYSIHKEKKCEHGADSN